MALRDRAELPPNFTHFALWQCALKSVQTLFLRLYQEQRFPSGHAQNEPSFPKHPSAPPTQSSPTARVFEQATKIPSAAHDGLMAKGVPDAACLHGKACHPNLERNRYPLERMSVGVDRGERRIALHQANPARTRAHVLF